MAHTQYPRTRTESFKIQKCLKPKDLHTYSLQRMDLFAPLGKDLEGLKNRMCHYWVYWVYFVLNILISCFLALAMSRHSQLFMKKWLTIALFVATPFALYAQNETKPFFFNNRHMAYTIRFGFLKAGTMECKSETNAHLIEGKKCYKLEVMGKTAGTFAAFAKIQDRWMSYVDTSIGLPFRFIRELRENNYSKEELTEFDRLNNLAVVSTKTNQDEYQVATYNTPANVHDMISAYLALNATSLHLMKKNDIVQLNIFLDDSTFEFRLKYLGKEEIKTKYGKRDSFKISPIMPENSIFSKKEAIICWISADCEKIPLKLRAKVKIGTLELNLEKYSGYE